MVKLAIAIKNPSVRNHFRGLLDVVVPRLNQPSQCEVVDLADEQSQLIEYLKTFFDQDHQNMAVLISDWLAPSDSVRHRNSLIKECQAALGANSLGTIAIMRHPRRLPDVDRIVVLDCTDRTLQGTLELILARLEYIAGPTRTTQSDYRSINVRPLRTNETEFRDYLSLRHHVYTIMGYLDDEVEGNRSRLEVNEADVHAIHVGAFWRDGVRERLVGTARVVTNSPADTQLQEMLEAMVASDPVAKERLDTPYPLGLPIFQSHRGMNRIIHEIFTTNQRCGELSRVIVAREFRGSGISRMLIDETLRRGIGQGTERLFAECLHIHEKLYEHHGFQRISGIAGPVIDVGRTMIAMEMRAEAIAAIRKSPPQMHLAKAMDS